jgi:hypothetical protein
VAFLDSFSNHNIQVKNPLNNMQKDETNVGASTPEIFAIGGAVIGNTN